MSRAAKLPRLAHAVPSVCAQFSYFFIFPVPERSNKMSQSQPLPSSENHSLFAPTIVNLPPLPEFQRSNNDEPNIPPTSPRRSSPWQPDPSALSCTSCRTPFDPFNRRHHCRLCGMVFCHPCSDTRSLIPHTDLVLRADNHTQSFSFRANDAASQCDTSLEYRMNQARQPQRTCHPCRARLAPLQDELREKNSNASRYNFVHASAGVRSLCNSPLAFTLGHEVQKATYALANSLPREKRRGDSPHGGEWPMILCKLENIHGTK